MTIPIEWLERILSGVALFGVFLGSLSITSPARSIQLYQWMMRHFNWRVEPIDYNREVKTTRKFGIVIVVLCGLMIAALFRPEWFMFVRLPFGGLSW